MSLYDVYEAKSKLSKLIEQAEHGEEIIIAKAGKPVAKLIPYQKTVGRRKGGQWRGKIKIQPDFDSKDIDWAWLDAIVEKVDDDFIQAVNEHP
jgi:prevent-host-death family protein